MINGYVIHMIILIGIYLILSVSLNLALGYTGLLNLSHIAFYGIGAYSSALLTKAGCPFILAIIIGALITSLFGYILILATRKLKGDYLALATLGFGFVIFSLMINLTWLTNGPLGISGIPKPSIFGITISSQTGFLILTTVICLISLLIIYRIIKSPFGRLLQATRDDEIGLRVLGKNTFKLKAKAMMISAFFAGIAGGLFAHYINYISPTAFALNDVIFIFTIVIVGGIASFKGSIIATFIIVLLPELIKFLPISPSIMGPTRQVIYALILLGILLFKPKGLFGRINLE